MLDRTGQLQSQTKLDVQQYGGQPASLGISKGQTGCPSTGQVSKEKDLCGYLERIDVEEAAFVTERGTKGSDFSILLAGFEALESLVAFVYPERMQEDVLRAATWPKNKA